MSQSQLFGRRSARADDGGQRTTVVEEPAEVQRVLELVSDADCRAILEATGDEALSAQELSTRCDLPQSTTYRKLDQLTDAELLAERTRIRRSGAHTQEYCRLVEDVEVSLDGGGETTLSLERQGELAAGTVGLAPADD